MYYNKGRTERRGECEGERVNVVREGGVSVVGREGECSRGRIGEASGVKIGKKRINECTGVTTTVIIYDAADVDDVFLKKIVLYEFCTTARDAAKILRVEH